MGADRAMSGTALLAWRGVKREPGVISRMALQRNVLQKEGLCKAIPLPDPRQCV